MCILNYLFLFVISLLFFQKDETKMDKTICILTNFHKICIRQASSEASVQNAINKGKLWNMLK